MRRTLLISTVLVGVLFGVARAGDSPVFQRDRDVPVADRQPADQPVRHWRSFIVTSKVEAGLTALDNVYYSDNDTKGDVVLEVSPSLGAVSDWGRHQIQANLDLTYDDYARYSGENTFSGNAALSGRYDIFQYTNVSGGVVYAHGFESRFEPNTPDAAARPIRYDTSMANVGFSSELNRLKFVGTVNYAKFNYFDVASRVAGAASIDEDYRDNIRLTAMGRFEYAVIPATSVFIDYSHVNSDYRIKMNDHSSEGYNYNLGVSFGLTNLMTGEIEYGYLKRTYKNPAFKPVSGPSYKAKVSYFPTQLETITLTASRSVEETPAVNVSGYVKALAAIQVDHEWSRRLVLTGSYESDGYKYNGVDRNDKRNNVYVGAKYSLTRNLSLKGGYTYRSLSSKGIASVHAYKENAVGVSLNYAF